MRTFYEFWQMHISAKAQLPSRESLSIAQGAPSCLFTPIAPEATNVLNFVHYRLVLRISCKWTHTYSILFCERLLWLSPTFLRFIHIVCINILHSYFFYFWVAFYSVGTLTVLSLIHRHLGSLHDFLSFIHRHLGSLHYLAKLIKLLRRLEYMSLLVGHTLSLLWGLVATSHMIMAPSILIYWQAQRSLLVLPGCMMWSLRIQTNCLCLNSDSILL